MNLYKWQENAIDLSKKQHNLALFCAMGVGKTCAAINIIRDKFTANKRVMRTLILGPVSVMFNWQREILKFSKIKDEYIFVSTGSGAKRVNDLAKFLKHGDKHIIITNYESLRNKELFKLLDEFVPEILLCDESHLVKAYNSQQSKLTYMLAKNAIHTYILTGTPILNSPMDIFMQYKILDKGETFGSNFFSFRNTYFFDANACWAAKGGNYFPNYQPRKELFPLLKDKIYSKAIRVLKEECLDLPERICQIYDVELSPNQKKAYKEMKRDLITFIDNNKGESKAVIANLALTKALRLQQIVTGFVTAEDGSILDLGDNQRLQVTKELLSQLVSEHKVILWCSFKHNYRQLEKICKELKIEYVFITGEQSTKQKQESIDRFDNDPKVRVVIANRRAGGTGINLIQASYSIIFSRNFSLAEENQSMDRNHRSGSEIHKQIVKIDLVAKGSIDEMVVRALSNKQEISKILLDNIDCI